MPYPKFQFIENSLKKIGYSFSARREGGRVVGGNLLYFMFNGEIVHYFRYNLRYVGEITPFERDWLQEKTLLDNDILFEMFLNGVLVAYQYVGYLKRKNRLLAGKLIKLTKKDVGVILDTLNAVLVRRFHYAIKYRDSQSRDCIFTEIRIDLSGLRDDEFIGEKRQSSFLTALGLNERTIQDEICLFGLMTENKICRFSLEEYLNYAKVIKHRVESVLSSGFLKQPLGEKTIWIKKAEDSFQSRCRVIYEKEDEYVVIPDSLPRQLEYFDLFRFWDAQDSERISFLEFRERRGKEMVLYCPQIIRATLFDLNY